MQILIDLNLKFTKSNSEKKNTKSICLFLSGDVFAKQEKTCRN